MSIAVVYRSKTGFTKRYAEWIGEELNCDIIDVKNATKETLSKYDTIIFGTGIYAEGMAGLEKFKRKMSKLNGKKFIVFATGAVSADNKKIEEIINRNFTPDERKTIPFFFFQSGLNYEKMGFVSRLMMKMFSSMLDKKKDKTEEEQALADVIKKSFDNSKKEYINQLVEYVKSV